MGNPRISVLLPCWNAARFLDRALESLRAQTFSDFEIVAVDDGSTDDTARVLTQWAAHEPRLRVIPRAHQGLVPALNAGLAEAREMGLKTIALTGRGGGRCAELADVLLDVPADADADADGE